MCRAKGLVVIRQNSVRRKKGVADKILDRRSHAHRRRVALAARKTCDAKKGKRARSCSKNALAFGVSLLAN